MIAQLKPKLKLSLALYWYGVLTRFSNHYYNSAETLARGTKKGMNSCLVSFFHMLCDCIKENTLFIANKGKQVNIDLLKLIPQKSYFI